jgi:hypothetical protein
VSVRVRLVHKEDPRKIITRHTVDAKEILRSPDCEWEPLNEAVDAVLRRKRVIPTPDELAAQEQAGLGVEEILGGDDDQASTSADDAPPAADAPRTTRGGKARG